MIAAARAPAATTGTAALPAGAGLAEAEAKGLTELALV